MTPFIIVIAGVASNTGKTTLLCELLSALAQTTDCEALKLTRGHYRSCGKDPHACCVSDLLGAQPTIRHGRAATEVTGKDTGRYWQAGAQQVHWVIATDTQVEQGTTQALAQVQSPVVLIEGTSVLPFVRADYAVLVARGDETKLKPSARKALANGLIDAWYLSNGSADEFIAAQIATSGKPWFGRTSLATLIAQMQVPATIRQLATT